MDTRKEAKSRMGKWVIDHLDECNNIKIETLKSSYRIYDYQGLVLAKFPFSIMEPWDIYECSDDGKNWQICFFSSFDAYGVPQFTSISNHIGTCGGSVIWNHYKLLCKKQNFEVRECET
jgi:hypothetical protein